MRESVNRHPKRALRADGADWIIDPFFMRATHDSVADHRCFDLVLLEEIGYLRGDRRIIADVAAVADPALNLLGAWVSGCAEHCRDQFGRDLVVGAIDRDGAKRILGFR